MRLRRIARKSGPNDNSGLCISGIHDAGIWIDPELFGRVARLVRQRSSAGDDGDSLPCAIRMPYPCSMKDLESVVTVRAKGLGVARGENGELLLLVHPDGDEPAGIAISEEMGEGLIQALRQVIDEASSVPAPRPH